METIITFLIAYLVIGAIASYFITKDRRMAPIGRIVVALIWFMYFYYKFEGKGNEL